MRDFYAPEPKARKFKSSNTPPYHPRTFLLWFALVAWVFITAVSIYAVVVSPILRWFMCMSVLLYVAQGVLLGGAEKMELFVYDQMRKPAQEWGRHNDVGGAGDASRKSRNPYDKYLQK